MTTTPSPSFFEALSYPAHLELRIIYSKDFDCLSYLDQQHLTYKDPVVSNSKKGNYRTCKVHILFDSYEHYINLRSQLSSHQEIQIVL